MTTPAVEIADTTPVSLLDDVRATRAAIDDAEVRLVRLALAWADAHPGDVEGVLPAVAPFVEGAEAVAGDAVWDLDGAAQVNDVDSYEWRGLPPVAYGAPEMFATANNMSSLAGLSFIRDALTLRHRLPGVWARVQAGHVPVWRARRIAQTVQGAADEIAAHVDVAATPIAHHIGARKLESLYDEAMLEPRRTRTRPNRGTRTPPRHPARRDLQPHRTRGDDHPRRMGGRPRPPPNPEPDRSRPQRTRQPRPGGYTSRSRGRDPRRPHPRREPSRP